MYVPKKSGTPQWFCTSAHAQCIGFRTSPHAQCIGHTICPGLPLLCIKGKNCVKKISMINQIARVNINMPLKKQCLQHFNMARQANQGFIHSRLVFYINVKIKSSAHFMRVFLNVFKHLRNLQQINFSTKDPISIFPNVFLHSHLFKLISK